MKKIGILTFHRSHNCGSIMQAFAIQEVINKYGIEPEIIDFSNKGQSELYSVLRPLKFNSKRDFAKSVYKNFIGITLYKRAKQNWSSYNIYLERQLNISKKTYSKNSDLVEEQMNYDIYLTGSDQVWNVIIDDYDDAYILNFVKDRTKIAYAVSQGAKDIKKYASDPNKYKIMIEDFDYLSVREPNGQKWLKEGFDIESEIVLDPTLLLDVKDYAGAEEPIEEKLDTDKYIFVYATILTKKFETIIRNIAKKEGLKIVIWQPTTWLKVQGSLKGYVLPKKQNPGKYLTLMKNAKYVFTASFHGVIFAAQYKTNFWVLQNNGMNVDTDDRILSLLQKFGFMNRLLKETDTNKDLSKLADYKTFVKRLEIERVNSFKFLEKAIGGK